jgi:ABC-type transporter Mla maintaining outer membrane lipid asymmetry permease subunit MlaE
VVVVIDLTTVATAMEVAGRNAGSLTARAKALRATDNAMSLKTVLQVKRINAVWFSLKTIADYMRE